MRLIGAFMKLFISLPQINQIGYEKETFRCAENEIFGGKRSDSG